MEETENLEHIFSYLFQLLFHAIFNTHNTAKVIKQAMNYLWGMAEHRLSNVFQKKHFILLWYFSRLSRSNTAKGSFNV